jgi:hypothetical protein
MNKETITYKEGLAYIGDKVLSNEFFYISDGSWYVEGSLCWLDVNCGEGGCLMIGIRAGDNQLDGELCSWDEFDIHDSNRVLVSVNSEED